MAIDMQPLKQVSAGDPTAKVTVSKAWLSEVHRLLVQAEADSQTAAKWRKGSVLGDRLADSGDYPWPLAYSLYGALGLLGVVLVSLGWVIGKTSVSGSVGGASFNMSGGEDPPVAAQIVADAAQETVDVIKETSQ